MTALSFGNNELIKNTLAEVEHDYDVCILDCSPGRFMLHNNIFQTADLLLIPNLPSPLSIYCNNMLMESLQSDAALIKKTLSFYNMVQVHKILHKQYLDERRHASWMLHNYIPFYSDIELITLTKESLFHQVKECRATSYYHNLWVEICKRMQWEIVGINGKVIDMDPEETSESSSIEGFTDSQWGEALNG